jgi:LuxR family maltose regulon positive regulatory protein
MGSCWWQQAAAATVALVSPQDAVDTLAPMIDGAPQALKPRYATVHALLFDAAAHDRLGDRRDAEGSIERALELAEPDGIVLPFALAPVRELLEHHPRHRTRHATLLSTILDLLAGSQPRAAGESLPLFDELSEAELRPSPPVDEHEPPRRRGQPPRRWNGAGRFPTQAARRS